MKKIIVLFVSILLLAGCSIGSDMTNNPTSRVEAYLDGYKRMDKKVMDDLDDIVEGTRYTIEQKTSYKELMKKHYGDIRYEIKEETVNGDRATVEVEIEVTDYSKVLTAETNPEDYADEEGDYVESLFFDYQLDAMKNSTDKVKYTLTFYLTKTEGTWILDELSEMTKEKIHGIYKY